MKILLDTLGSDKGYREIVNGAIKALKKHENLEITFIGNKNKINELIKDYKDFENRIDYINTDKYIKNTEEPVRAIRRNKDSSLYLGFKELKLDEYSGLLSCGSTGALLAGATLIVKRLKNISRAALTIVYPTEKEPCILLDAGANMDCSAKMLYQFAVMGNIYSEYVLNKTNPSIGLLNIGAEEGKGDKLRKETFELLKESKFNFIGNVEAREFLSGNTDTIITDGFSGNILLKTTEGTALTLMGNLKKNIMKSFKSKIGAVLLKDALLDLKNMLDYNEYGAAPLLGVKKAVFKAHGSSNSRAIETGIDTMITFIENNIIEKIEEQLNKENEIG